MNKFSFPHRFVYEFFYFGNPAPHRKEKSMNKSKSFFDARTLTGVGIFAALAAVVSFLTSVLKVGFLSIDAGDIVIVIASFIYGPVSGAAVSLISALASFLYSGTGFWGFFMDFVSSAAFACMASFIYSRKRDFKSAIIGIGVSVLTTTLIMIPMNRLITPLFTMKYFGNDLQKATEYVVSLIPTLLIPFNFAKALLNGAAALVLYKPLVRAMRAAKLIPPSKSDTGAPSAGRRMTVMSIVIGCVAIAAAVAVLVVISLSTEYDFAIGKYSIVPFWEK